MGPTEPFFPYRAWSISSWGNWELFEKNLDRALEEAPRHNISCIELQDYTRSFIDIPPRFDNWPKLKNADVLTYRFRGHGATPLSPDARAEEAARLKRMAEKIRAAGLELQVWYHAFRDWPLETFDLYPELKDAGGEALWQFVGDTLREAFEYFPEITGLTVTSLCETPRLLEDESGASPFDRILRLYRTIHDACEEKGRRLILRDFIVRKEEFDFFERALEALPETIWIETKDVLADWSGHEKPINPFIHRYAQKKNPLVIEFELANNFTGETEVPWCDPEQIWRRIRFMAELGLQGGVGRLMNADFLTAGTLFDTPNEINAWAMSRLLCDPGRVLSDPDDAWDRTYDQFDMRLWKEWADLRYGPAVAVEVIQILQTTPRITDLMFNVCGAHDNWTGGPGDEEAVKNRMLHPTRNVPAAIRAVDACGTELALAEKDEMMRLIETACDRIGAMKKSLSAPAWENLHGAFDRARHLGRIYQAMIQAFVAALEVDAGAAPRQALADAAEGLRRAGDAAAEAYYPELFWRTPANARIIADFFEEMPGKVAEYRRMNIGREGFAGSWYKEQPKTA
jgi:hypothetical protein